MGGRALSVLPFAEEQTVAQLTDEYIAKATAETVAAGGEGCSSFEGCAEGEGCGGCEGQKGELVAYHASVLDNLACCLYMNGKSKQAIATIERSIELQPDSEDYPVRLASFKKRK